MYAFEDLALLWVIVPVALIKKSAFPPISSFVESMLVLKFATQTLEHVQLLLLVPYSRFELSRIIELK